jgi:ketosteroid isomerase-like protein
MMASKNVDSVKAAHAAFNARNWASLRGLVAEDCVFTDGRGISHRGSEAFANDYSKAWADAFSDAEVTDAKYYDAGDTVVTEFVGRGTNDGQLGPMPPTSRRVDLPYCEVYHFGSDGKVSGGHAYFDMYGLLVQLGHAEPAG